MSIIHHFVRISSIRGNRSIAPIQLYSINIFEYDILSIDFTSVYYSYKYLRPYKFLFFIYAILIYGFKFSIHITFLYILIHVYVYYAYCQRHTHPQSFRFQRLAWRSTIFWKQSVDKGFNETKDVAAVCRSCNKNKKKKKTWWIYLQTMLIELKNRLRSLFAKIKFKNEVEASFRISYQLSMKWLKYVLMYTL